MLFLKLYFSIKSGKLQELSESVIRPFYLNKLNLFQEALNKSMPQINWYLHKAEGSLFCWLWIDEEWMNDLRLYQALKKKGVLIVPGSTFFPGLREKWDHKNRCVRISLTASDKDIQDAAAVMANVLSTKLE